MDRQRTCVGVGEQHQHLQASSDHEAHIIVIEGCSKVGNTLWGAVESSVSRKSGEQSFSHHVIFS